MDATAFRDSITKDPNFRGEVQGFQVYACNGETGRTQKLEACKDMARVYLKQEALQRKLAQAASKAAPGTEEAKIAAEPDWLVRMRTATQGHVWAVSREDAKQAP
jgi:hypothetical protein